MRVGVALAILAASFAGVTGAEAAPAYAKISTTKGDIVVELYADKAPKTVENFLQYTNEGHYDRTIIHRVVKGVLFQGGGYSRLYTERPTRPPIPYEGANGVKNERGTIAMARQDDPASATAQWFINLQDSPKLDHRVTDLGPIYGYAVFGRVIKGMEVADEIGAVPTAAAGPFDAEVPVEMIFINRIDAVEQP